MSKLNLLHPKQSKPLIKRTQPPLKLQSAGSKVLQMVSQQVQEAMSSWLQKLAAVREVILQKDQGPLGLK